jgi:3-deoxy-7-phosphoheptulonate synthase
MAGNPWVGHQPLCLSASLPLCLSGLSLATTWHLHAGQAKQNFQGYNLQVSLKVENPLTSTKTDDLNISEIRPLLSPAVLLDEFPLSADNASFVSRNRHTIEAILNGTDSRLLVVVGPCSIHDNKAAIEYAERLKPIATDLQDSIFIAMRVYFEKPRTVMGWKGLINDPDLDESFHINKGLRSARKLLLSITELGLPCATEFLDTTFGQFYADLISWGAIGARTVESQMHRQLASGLSMPVGIKNRTDGDIQVAIDALLAARHQHLFPSLTKEGAPALFVTTGNQGAHLVLRGGTATGPNYTAEHIDRAVALLRSMNLDLGVMVDCSHGNSNKQASRQIQVAENVVMQRKIGQKGISGIMLESHLKSGRQDLPQNQASLASLTYGQSITDECLSIEDTAKLLYRLAESL